MKIETQILGDQWSKHVTPAARKGIRLMLDGGHRYGKVGRAVFYLTKQDNQFTYFVREIVETRTIGKGPEKVRQVYRVKIQ